MNKIIVLLVSCLLLFSCKSEKPDNSEKNLNNQTELDIDKREVEELLEPLISGIFLETSVIQGAKYKEGMKLEDLREFLLKYYTEEIANETCDLIIYKSDLGHGVDYSGMFYYDKETDIFYLDGSNALEKMPENPMLKIEKIITQTEDRIEIIAYPNWILETSYYWLEENHPFTGNIQERPLLIVLEKEGYDWYLGDLVFTRATINEANREYRKR